MECTERKSSNETRECQHSSKASVKTSLPIDKEWIRAQLSSFNSNTPVQESWLPPSSWYIQPEFYQLEQDTVFKNNWLIAARIDQLREPGQYVSGNMAGEPFVIVRTESGELRAFYNVCRHHAAEVAQGDGCLDKLQCPYHGWTYSLEGNLLSAPGLGAVKNFDRQYFGLVPMHVAEWGGLVFICRGEEPRDLQADLAGLKSELDKTDFGTLQFAERRTYILNCNWKVFVDNYLDGGYHVQYLHKGLANQLDLSTYATDLFGRYSIQSTAGTAARNSTAPYQHSSASGEDFAERLGDKAVYAWLYPNLMINRYGTIMDTNWVLPLGHDRTQVIIDFYFENTDGTQARAFIERCITASEVVQAEDIQISESVQRGLRSSSYDKGRYASRELAEHHFHCLLTVDFQLLKENSQAD